MRAGERGGAPARADLEHHEVAPVEELDEEVGLVVRGAGGSLHPGPRGGSRPVEPAAEFALDAQRSTLLVLLDERDGHTGSERPRTGELALGAETPLDI